MTETGVLEKAFVGMTTPEKKKPSEFDSYLNQLVAYEKRRDAIRIEREKLLEPFSDREEKIQAMICNLENEQSKFNIITEDVTATLDEEFQALGDMIVDSNKVLAELWTDQAKTQEVDGWRVSRRDLKRLEIVQKKWLVEQLIKCNKIEESIKTFDKNILMKLTDLNFLDSSAVLSKIHKSITAKKIEKISDIT